MHCIHNTIQYTYSLRDTHARALGYSIEYSGIEIGFFIIWNIIFTKISPTTTGAAAAATSTHPSKVSLLLISCHPFFFLLLSIIILPLVFCSFVRSFVRSFICSMMIFCNYIEYFIKFILRVFIFVCVCLISSSFAFFFAKIVLSPLLCHYRV